MAAEADGNGTPTITSEMNQSDSESQSGEKSDVEFSDGDNTAMGEEVSSNDDMEKIEKEGIWKKIVPREKIPQSL